MTTPTPVVVRVGGAFVGGRRGLGESDNEAVYYWRFVGEVQGLDAVAYLFRDIDTACAYLEAVWALLPTDNDAAQWSLVRTPLPERVEILPIASTFVSDYQGGPLLLAASRFMDTLRRMGLSSLYRDQSVAVTMFNVAEWDPTAHSLASVWTLESHLVSGFLFEPPVDGEQEDAPLNPRHWSWRRRGDRASVTPTDVDYVRRLSLYRPVAERHMSLARLPKEMPQGQVTIIERYHFDLVATEDTAMGPARHALRLATFPADGKSRPALSEVESWFNRFLAEDSTTLGKDEPGIDLQTYRITMAVIALAFGDPLGGAWFACASRAAANPYAGPPLLCHSAEGKDITEECQAKELLMVMGYVHSQAPMFIDWATERRRGRLFPLVRLRGAESVLRLEFPYVGTNSVASAWAAHLLHLVVAQSPTNTPPSIIEIAMNASTPLRALPPLYRPTRDGRHWETGLESATQVVAEAYRQFLVSHKRAPRGEFIQEFIASGVGESTLLARPHLTRDAFFQPSTWMGLVDIGSPSYDLLTQLLAKRYPTAQTTAVAPPVQEVSKVDSMLASILDGIINLPSKLRTSILLMYAGKPVQWSLVLSRQLNNSGWFNTLLNKGTVTPPASSSDDQDNPFRYSLAGSFLLESDFTSDGSEENVVVVARAKKESFFILLNNLLDDETIFPTRTPWFLPMFTNGPALDLIIHAHKLMLHPANAILHRALASGNEQVLATLLEWRKNPAVFSEGSDEDALNALKSLPSAKDQMVAELLFIAFMVGQTRLSQVRADGGGGVLSTMKASVAATLLMPKGKPYLITGWILYEALRIGDLELLQFLLAQDSYMSSSVDFRAFLCDIEGMPRPLFLREHLDLLARHYESGATDTYFQLATIKARITSLFQDREPPTRGPRLNLDPTLSTAKALYESVIVGKKRDSPFAWDATADYDSPTNARSYTSMLIVGSIKAWSTKPELFGLQPKDEQQFPLAVLLGLAGRMWLRRNVRSPYMPDILLVLKAHWRSFINAHVLAKVDAAAMAATAKPLPTPEAAAAIVSTPVRPSDVPEGGISSEDEDDPFSPTFDAARAFRTLILPPSTPSHSLATPPRPNETDLQKRARLFMDKVRREADAPHPRGYLQPIYSIDQAAHLVKPSVPGFWLLPFYTSSFSDQRVAELLQLRIRHLDARIENLTLMLTSMGALIASHGILARRMVLSKSFDLEATPFDFNAADAGGSTFWSDLETGLRLLSRDSQLVTMFTTLSRERLRLLVTHPIRSVKLTLPVLKHLMQGITMPRDTKRSTVGTFDLVSRSVDEANKRGGDDLFRPVLVQTRKIVEAKPMGADDEISFVAPGTRTVVDDTKALESQITNALNVLRSTRLPHVAEPARADQHHRTQIRRLAATAFPALNAPDGGLSKIDDKGQGQIPPRFVGMIDSELRINIERAISRNAAANLLLLLVNEPRKSIAQPAYRRAKISLPPQLDVAMRALHDLGQAYKMDAAKITLLADWLYDHAHRPDSDFGFTGMPSRQMLIELTQRLADLRMFFDLFGPIPVDSVF